MQRSVKLVQTCPNLSKLVQTCPNSSKLVCFITYTQAVTKKNNYFYLPTRYLFQLLSKDQMSPVCSTRYTYLSRMKKISDDHGSHKSFISFTFTFLLPLSLIFMALKKIDDLQSHHTHKKQAGFSLSPLMLPFYALDHNDLMTSATTRYYEYTSCLLDGKHHHTLSLSESVVKIQICM